MRSDKQHVRAGKTPDNPVFAGSDDLEIALEAELHETPVLLSLLSALLGEGANEDRAEGEIDAL